MFFSIWYGALLVHFIFYVSVFLRLVQSSVNELTDSNIISLAEYALILEMMNKRKEIILFNVAELIVLFACSSFSVLLGESLEHDNFHALFSLEFLLLWTFSSQKLLI
jgi:hypothetical protein